MNSFIFALVLGVGTPATHGDRADLIELNHKYDDKGVHVFDQLIFWTRDPRCGKYRVRAWSLVDPRDENHKRPVLRNGMYTCFVDTSGRIIEVRSPLFRESWSSVDPESEDRKVSLEFRYPLVSPLRVPLPKEKEE